MEKEKRELTQEEWLNLGKELFGKDIKRWKFKCPKCGHIASVQDFIDIGYDANDAFQNCIGRKKQDVGCDWAAYGLFGTLGKGIIVISEDGEKVQAFDFAKEDKHEYRRGRRI